MPDMAKLDQIRYKRSFLTEVIVRVDLVSPVPEVADKLPKSVVQPALGRFPIDEPKRALTQEVLVSDKETRTRQVHFTEWNFHDRQRTKRFAINPEFLFLTYSHYESYEQLRDDFTAVMKPFFDNYSEAQAKRLGLRYINQLNGFANKPAEWDEYVDSPLLGLFRYEVPDGRPTRIFHSLELSFEEFNLRFQFGAHNPDYPAPITQSVFMLDFDAYYQGLLEPGDLVSKLDAYHARIQWMFEKSITDATRTVLNEE